MKLAEFTYTKANGDVSQRVAVVESEPANNYQCLDVSELDTDQFAQFTQEYNQLLTEWLETKAQLLAKYDLTHNIRQFVPQRMTNVALEWV